MPKKVKTQIFSFVRFFDIHKPTGSGDISLDELNKFLGSPDFVSLLKDNSIYQEPANGSAAPSVGFAPIVGTFDTYILSQGRMHLLNLRIGIRKPDAKELKRLCKIKESAVIKAEGKITAGQKREIKSNVEQQLMHGASIDESDVSILVDLEKNRLWFGAKDKDHGSGNYAINNLQAFKEELKTLVDMVSKDSGDDNELHLELATLVDLDDDETNFKIAERFNDWVLNNNYPQGISPSIKSKAIVLEGEYVQEEKPSVVALKNVPYESNEVKDHLSNHNEHVSSMRLCTTHTVLVVDEDGNEIEEDVELLAFTLNRKLELASLKVDCGEVEDESLSENAEANSRVMLAAALHITYQVVNEAIEKIKDDILKS